jgi:protein-tyrosine phosphatase
VADAEGKIVKDGIGGGVAGNIGFGHFWEMVWQEDVEVLIMLTRCVEKGAEKCGVYYPEAVGETLELEGEEDVWGAVTCETFKLEWETEIRELKLMKRKGKADLNQDAEVDGSIQVEERKIWHFLFLGWPDHDVPQTPEDRKALLELIRMTRFRINAGIDHESEPQEHPQPLETLSPNPSSQAKSKPRIVHCSAGVGRTGTFIALDHLLQELEEGRFDDMAGETDDHDPVFECVKRLREQRMYMVYKPAQYFYIYQTLREIWNVHCTKVVSKIND